MFADKQEMKSIPPAFSFLTACITIVAFIIYWWKKRNARINAGEDYATAAKRELKEELGIEAEIEREIAAFPVIRDGKKVAYHHIFAVHSDEKNEKSTYVTLLGLEEAQAQVETWTEEAIGMLRSLPGDVSFLEALFSEMTGRRA